MGGWAGASLRGCRGGGGGLQLQLQQVCVLKAFAFRVDEQAGRRADGRSCRNFLQFDRDAYQNIRRALFGTYCCSSGELLSGGFCGLDGSIVCVCVFSLSSQDKVVEEAET